jgi:hypothetical protein
VPAFLTERLRTPEEMRIVSHMRDQTLCGCVLGIAGDELLRILTLEKLEYKKFIDPHAEFVFLPHETDWAQVTAGTVYDVPNCELGHRGEDGSFGGRNLGMQFP